MNRERNQVNQIIRQIVILEAIRKVRLIMVILLIIEFFLNKQLGLILLIWMGIGPFLVEQMLKKDRTKEYVSILPEVCKKYRFDQKVMKGNVIAWFICILFLLVSYYVSLHNTMLKWYVVYTPLACVLLTIASFIGWGIYYRVTIGNLLRNNLL